MSRPKREKLSHKSVCPYVPIEFLVSERLNFYTLLVFNNAHLKINMGRPVKEVCEYASEYLPFTPLDIIESEIRDRSRNPLNRTYQYAYAISYDFIQSTVHKLTAANKIALLKTLYHKALTPKQIRDYVEEIQK